MRVVQALHGIYEVCYNSEMFLNYDQLNLLSQHCSKLGVHYQRLAVHSLHAGQMKWKQLPKHYYVVGHLPWQAKLVNPVYVQGYCYESMVGTLASIY